MIARQGHESAVRKARLGNEEELAAIERLEARRLERTVTDGLGSRP